MGLQIACLRECLVTLWTAEWFVISVDFIMGLQIAWNFGHFTRITDDLSATKKSVILVVHCI